MFFPIAYYNNQFLDAQEISIDPKDLGIQRGYSVFDFFKLKNLSNPNIDDYISRFFNSCKSVRLDIQKSRDEIRNITTQVLQQNGTRDGYVKIIASGGTSINGFNKENGPSILAMGMPIKEWDEKYYKIGTKLLMSDYRRDIPHVKTTNYMHAAMQADSTKEAGAIDLLYYDRGLIRETSRSNIFLIIGGELFTPSENILEGITRKRVLETDIGIIHHKQDIPVDLISTADEIFITSTTKGVMPIIEIDNNRIGTGKVGPYTQQYMNHINSF